MLFTNVNSIARFGLNSAACRVAVMATKARKTLEPWQKEDAARLFSLWERRDPRISQAAAATEWGIGETQGIVWQYLHGAIPLNLPVAVKFARGLGCSVSDISPSLAKLLPPGGASEPLSSRVELIVELVKLLTPEQQGELLPALRATVDANRLSQTKLQKTLRTIGNARVEDAFGIPEKRRASPAHRKP